MSGAARAAADTRGRCRDRKFPTGAKEREGDALRYKTATPKREKGEPKPSGGGSPLSFEKGVCFANDVEDDALRQMIMLRNYRIAFPSGGRWQPKADG